MQLSLPHLARGAPSALPPEPAALPVAAGGKSLDGADGEERALRCLELLLEHGADATAGVDGHSALMKAIELGRRRCVQRLLNAGVDPNRARDNLSLALHTACDLVSEPTALALARALLQAGAHVQAQQGAARCGR
eukprot:scaffold241229_cov30-Tisochrysis_lutea.AAC.2